MSETAQQTEIEVPKLDAPTPDVQDIPTLAGSEPVATKPRRRGGSYYKAVREGRVPQDGELPRRRRGRPTNAERAARAAEGELGELSADGPAGMPDGEKKQLADALTTAFQLSGQLMASRRGSHWELSDMEAQTLGAAWVEALAPFMGPGLGKYGGLVLASILTAGLVGKRVAQDAKRSAVPQLVTAEGAA